MPVSVVVDSTAPDGVKYDSHQIDIYATDPSKDSVLDFLLSKKREIVLGIIVDYFATR